MQSLTLEKNQLNFSKILSDDLILDYVICYKILSSKVKRIYKKTIILYKPNF